MDMLIASAVFLCGIFLCMAMGWSLAIGLAFGLVCFTLAARRRGHSWRALASMAGDGARTAMVVLRVLVFRKRRRYRSGVGMGAGRRGHYSGRRRR